MMVTIFRSRLRDGVDEDYIPTAARMVELATTMPGFISHKRFTADDGERLTVVEFESLAALLAWRMHPDHREAQRQGRDSFYEEYQLQTCEVVREMRFRRSDAEALPATGV